MAEAEWLARRLQLRALLERDPERSTRSLARELHMGEATVRKWRRAIAAHPDDQTACFSQSRARKTPPPAYPEPVIARSLEVRDHPPGDLNRIPGARTIQYYLAQDTSLAGLCQPHSIKTIWKLLHQHQRIPTKTPRTHEAVPRPAPMTHWQIDFKEASSVPATPDGKQHQVVELLNVVDVGTSLVVFSQAREDFQMPTVIDTLVQLVEQHGLPERVQMDRDPRFIGGAHHPNLPPPLVQFFLCLGGEVIINPPQRPDLNAFVERYHRALKYECLAVKQPQSLAEVQEAATTFQQWYNTGRPHQGLTCGNQPPRVAHPNLPARPGPPLVVDPGRWVEVLAGQSFARRVQKNGSLVLYGRPYYVGQALAGRR